VGWLSSNLFRHLVASARASALQIESTTRENVSRVIDRLLPARVFMLGEASHGTHDFYHFRTCITKHLIEKHGLTAVAVEGDWPDAVVCPLAARLERPAPKAQGRFLRARSLQPEFIGAGRRQLPRQGRS
jgi:erythromycin esterase-like protein